MGRASAVCRSFHQSDCTTRHLILHPHRHRHGLHHPPPRREGGRIALEHGLRRLGVIQINSPPAIAGRSHASTRCSRNGSNTHPGATNIDELHAHSTPSSTNRSTAAHTGHCPPSDHRHQRVRTDHVDIYGGLSLRVDGRLHHISIGRAHARTRVPRAAHEKALSPQREPRAIRMSCNITCVAGTAFEPV